MQRFATNHREEPEGHVNELYNTARPESGCLMGPEPPRRLLGPLTRERKIQHAQKTEH